MRRFLFRAVLAVALIALAEGSLAQAPEVPPDSTGLPVQPAPDPMRASWVSDRSALQVGEILTVVLDEQTVARERISRVATANRSQGASASLNTNFDTESMDNSAAFDAAMKGDSRDVGELNRQGDLSGVLSVRVIAVGPDGIAEIQGGKHMNVDGRKQETTLHGFIRPEDVSPSNVVFSSSIADATISYKGKALGPRRGLIGRIFSLLWP